MPKHIVEGTPEHEEWKRKEAERVAAIREKKKKESGSMTQPKRTTLAIQQIVADEQIQPRLSLNSDDVEGYKQVIEAGGEMEPLVVFFDGKINWLSSGFTRRKAYELADVTEIPVEVREGTKRDAWLFAKSANKHGRRFTNEEKRRNVIEMLEDEECKQWSDRRIALHIGVDHKTVSQYRSELSATGEIPQSNVRVGRDGREYQTSNIGKSQSRETPSSPDPNEGSGSIPFEPGNAVFWRNGEGDVSFGYFKSLREGFPDQAWIVDDKGSGVAFVPLEQLQRDDEGLDEAPDDLNAYGDEQPAEETDGYGRPVSSVPSSSTPAQPDLAPTPEEKAAALPLYRAMKRYGHVGHLLLSAATAWYQLEDARNKFAFAHSRAVPKHATGTFFDEANAFLRIPDPAKWEGCAACKGSMRVGDGEKCASCKGGFTTHIGEGVSADVVSSHTPETV